MSPPPAPPPDPRAGPAPEERDPARELMLRFQGGDEAAFDELVRATERDVFALAYRYGLDAQRADDIAQETYLRVWRSRASYQPTAKFRAWLLRIAANLIVSEARASKRRRTVPLGGAAGAGGGGEPEEGISLADPRAERPEAPLDRAETSRAIAAALEQLPDTQRIALVMNRFHEASYQEVAEALSMSVEAVKSLLFRARQNLKDRLAGFLDDAETSGGGERSR